MDHVSFSEYLFKSFCTTTSTTSLPCLPYVSKVRPPLSRVDRPFCFFRRRVVFLTVLISVPSGDYPTLSVVSLFLLTSPFIVWAGTSRFTRTTRQIWKKISVTTGCKVVFLLFYLITKKFSQPLQNELHFWIVYMYDCTVLRLMETIGQKKFVKVTLESF